MLAPMLCRLIQYKIAWNNRTQNKLQTVTGTQEAQTTACGHQSPVVYRKMKTKRGLLNYKLFDDPKGFFEHCRLV